VCFSATTRFYVFFLFHFVFCRGDDLWGMPTAEQSAGWHPRSLHDARMRRPAPPDGPAAPAAGWRLHRGEPEPGDEDKSPPTAVSLKVAWPRQDQQRQRTGVMNATTGLDQSAIKEPSPRKDPRQKGGHMPPRCRSKGERRFIKRDHQSGARGSRRGRSHGGAGSRPNRHLTYNQTPTYIRGSGPLD
jgi:hypothetical protein